MSSSSSTAPRHMSSDDPFDSLLSLEDDYYNQGYAEGVADGALAGRTEGRQLGLEKGYQKFFESGRLYGRAILWANRLPKSTISSSSSSSNSFAQNNSPLPPTTESSSSTSTITIQNADTSTETIKKQLPSLPRNPRLEKNIRTLYALVETESLSTENNDDAVNDFDDRLKRAQGKAKIIERMVGEKGVEEAAAAAAAAASPGGNGRGQTALTV